MKQREKKGRQNEKNAGKERGKKAGKGERKYGKREGQSNNEQM